MQLPGRLKATTLGDLLGSLHRAAVTGVLELVEASGRNHRVHLAEGKITAVEIDRAAASLGEILRGQDEVDDDILRRSLLRAMASQRLHGEVLVRDFHLSPEVVGRALRQQLLMRLRMLEELGDAQVHYRVTVRPPRGALVDEPLAPTEFLHGRRRARDRERDRERETTSGTYRTTLAPGAIDHARIAAFRTLGLAMDASSDDVKRAYRRLVREYHPDLHPEASSDERRTLSSRFVEVTKAYRSLVA